MKSFLSHLKTIGEDILKGIEIAAPIAAQFTPAIGPILTEVAQVITVLENKGVTVDPTTLSQIVNAIALTNTAKQVAAAG